MISMNRFNRHAVFFGAICFCVVSLFNFQTSSSQEARKYRAKAFWLPPIPKDEPTRRQSEETKQESFDVETTIELDRSAWFSQKVKWEKHRPELEQLVKKDEIVGDVRPLLDFAILGHAKCATTFISQWLSSHPSIQIWDYEVCDLYDGRPDKLSRKLYEELPRGDYQRGFKCPGHFARRSLRYFRRYFSKAHLIVGVRHPVRWFESYYNFRVRHGNWTMPEPQKLIGECIPEGHGVCTDRANFHASLSMFGQTNLSDPSEHHLLRLRDKYALISQIDNPVFLYDTAQLYDSDEGRKAQFRRDLADFMGLDDLPDPPVEERKKPKPKAIDVCDPSFDKIREELLLIGKRASIWIRKYYLESSNAYVSNREFFEETLQTWKEDPCTAKD